MTRLRTRAAAILIVAIAASLAILGVSSAATTRAHTHGSVAFARPAASQLSNGKITISVWDPLYFPKQSGQIGAVGRAESLMDKAFEQAYPNIHVNHIGFDGSQFITGMRQFVTSHKGPDIVTDGGGSFPQTAGFAEGLRPMYDLLTPQLKKQLTPYLQGEGIGDAAHYSIPILGSVYTFYYNKALFNKAGISGAPVTFEQLLSDCTALQKVGVTPITNGWSGSGGTIPWNYGITNQVLGPNGLTAWANRTLGWNDPRLVQGAKYLQQMAAQGCFGDRASAAVRTDADGASMFDGGRGAMLFYFLQDKSTFSAIGGASNVGAFPFPRLPTSAYPAGTPDSGYDANWSMSKYTKHCRAAWNYISFFVSPKAQAILYKISGFLPVNNQVTVKASTPLDAQILKMAANKYGHHGIGATMSGQEATLQQQIAPELISGQLSPDSFISQMQTLRSTLPPLPAPGSVPKPSPCN